MNPLESELNYPLGDALPASGYAIEVAPGVRWVRMGLPFALNHVNLWLVDEGDGWTVIDGEKLRQELERTCVSDLKVAGCAKPKCSCRAKLAAAPASQPASAPASQRTAKLATKKPPRPTTDDLPRPSEARVEAFP